MSELKGGFHWYVAYVKSCQEKKAADMLERLGVEYYLPVQRVMKRLSDRIKMVDRLVISGMIFVRSSETERIRVIETVPYMTKYMGDRSTHRAVIVPDGQMDDFKKMVLFCSNEVSFSSDPIVPGDNVRIISGPLTGMECELARINERNCAVLRMPSIGTAYVEVSMDAVKKIL